MVGNTRALHDTSEVRSHAQVRHGERRIRDLQEVFQESNSKAWKQRLTMGEKGESRKVQSLE